MKTEFKLSAASKAQFITDRLPKLVFAGRSNVGKSSVLNCLTGKKNLARVGSAPGKTSHVNYFLIDDGFYFVDLPGYGYAKRSHAEKLRWAELMEDFFAQNDQITLGIMVVDVRHKPTELDIQMAAYFQQTCVPWMVIANKTDKLKASEIPSSLELIKKTLVLDDSVPLLPLSSEKGSGKNEVMAVILKAVKN